mgnify:CR=1 FL=1
MATIEDKLSAKYEWYACWEYKNYISCEKTTMYDALSGLGGKFAVPIPRKRYAEPIHILKTIYAEKRITIL